MNGVRVGLALARERLRGPTALLVLFLSCAVAFAIGVLERRIDPASAADAALRFAVFGIALPLFSYLVSERVCAGMQLERSLDIVARHGADRRVALVGLLLTSSACTAFAVALLAICALLGAHPLHSAALGTDLRASIGIALLAGSAYALYFAAAATLGTRGAGRKWALIVDFVLGGGGSALAAPWPRGHVRNLLGGEPVADLSQASAWAALAAIAVVCAGVSLLRTRE